MLCGGGRGDSRRNSSTGQGWLARFLGVLIFWNQGSGRWLRPRWCGSRRQGINLPIWSEG